MNIVYLHSHDTGRAIEPYGYAVRTPAMRRLAEEGVLFRDAHCAAPTCSPSRAALLTGESAHGAGMVALAHRGGRLKHPERHLARYLGERGYETVLAGIQHVCSWKEDHGYSVAAGDIDRRHGEEIVDFAVKFIEERGQEKPFFLDAGFVETHRTEAVAHGFNWEWSDRKDGDGKADHCLPPPPLPDVPETRRDWLDYAHSVERLDGFYGKIVEAIDRAGLADETLVIVTTDHGVAFPFHKCSLTSRGTGVLLILRGPKGFGGGKVVDAMASHLDLYPTICDFLGLDKPDWLEGRALQPLVSGEVDTLHDELFAEVTFHAAFEPKRSARTERWSYIRNYAAPRTVMPNTDYGYSKQYFMDRGLAEREVPGEELYDLAYDPWELNNLAGSEAHAEVLREMRERLARWMKRTRDPLLEADAEAVLPLPLTVNTWDQDNPGKEGSGDWDVAQWGLVRRGELE